MFRFIKGVAFFIIGTFLFGFISMSLWNALIPDLFHGPVITYWQSLGLLILGKLFFGGFGGKGGCHKRHRHWTKEWGKDWETYNGWRTWGEGWEEKIKNMTPAEREDWKRTMKQQWCSAKEKMQANSESDEKEKS